MSETASQEMKHLIGIDADAVAIEHSKEKLLPILSENPGLTPHFIKGNFK